MEIATQLIDNVRVLTLTGSFTNSTAQPARQWFEEATNDGPAYLVVDLSGVHFMDSTALSTLVYGLKRAREQGGDLRLCGLRPPVRMIIEMTRLDRVFEIFYDEADAVEAFRRGAPAETPTKEEDHR